jgi:hypothetical protein
MRAVQPPDVARQAIRELDVLARELGAVPAALDYAGLAQEQRRAYFETVSAYVDLARLAWEAIAEERLEQTGAEPEYRQRAIGVARRLTRMQHQARQNTPETRATRGGSPWLWRTRVRLVREGLRNWQASLSAPADPLRMGEGLYELRGSLSLALAGGVALLSLRLVTEAALVATPLLTIALALQLVQALAAGQSTHAVALALAALGSLAVWVLTLVLTSFGKVRLGAVLGASCFSRTHSPCNGRAGSALVGGLLRLWWLLVSLAGTLGTAATLGFAIEREVAAGALPTAQSIPTLLGQIGQVLGTVVILPALVSLATLAALALPTLALLVARFVGELGGNATWVPAARCYALGPSLSALAFVTGALFAAGIWVSSALGLMHSTLFTLTLGGHTLGNSPFSVTARAALLFGMVLVPYLLLHELPYRIGLTRWRRDWRSELSTRRADLESHVRRLSAADPRTGSQDTSEVNLRAMQYDLVLLDFYRAKDIEAQRVSAAPHGPAGPLVVVLVALICALVADGASTWLVTLH